MKWFLVLPMILALVASGSLFYDYAQPQRAPQPVPAIGVKIVGEDGWDGVTNYLPLVIGYSTASRYSTTSREVSGGDGGYKVNASYRIASSSPGHFFVLAHYTIARNGSFMEVDKALPVLPYYQPSPIAEENLKRPTWVNLDNHLSAFAYLSDSTHSY